MILLLLALSGDIEERLYKIDDKCIVVSYVCENDLCSEVERRPIVCPPQPNGPIEDESERPSPPLHEGRENQL